ncbi:MAG: hypothetical protein ABFD16_16910 [Thermoguttaceae bacterium]|jgi:hypothetical protein
MSRAGFAGLILGLIVLSTGCRMCAHPYDYCGPTFTGEGPCCPNEPRAGSVTAAGAMPVPEPATSQPGQPATSSPSAAIDYTMESPGAISSLIQGAEDGTQAVTISESPATLPSTSINETPGWTSQRRNTARPRSGR